MKRRDLLRHLAANNCYLKREGGSHSVFVNPANRAVTAVPRHSEIKGPTALKICRDLEIAPPANVA